VRCWLVEARPKKKGTVYSRWPRPLRSLAQNLMSENIPGIWSLAAQAHRRRRRLLSAARFHLSLCLSRPAFLGSVRLWSNEVEVKDGGRKEGRDFQHRGGWRWRWWRWQAVYLREVTRFSALLVLWMRSLREAIITVLLLLFSVAPSCDRSIEYFA
jgi:hypothetical protein